MTINDLRLILPKNTDIRVWNKYGPTEPSNPTLLFEGTLGDLALTNIISQEAVMTMLCTGSILVFYIKHDERQKQQRGIRYGKS